MTVAPALRLIFSMQTLKQGGNTKPVQPCQQKHLQSATSVTGHGRAESSCYQQVPTFAVCRAASGLPVLHPPVMPLVMKSLPL